MKREKGMALLMVMLLLALMATIAVGINQFWYSAFNRTLNQQSRIQAKWDLLGGETFARQWLMESLQSEPEVHLGQRWAKPGQSLRTEGGNIAITFSDAQACFNINSLNYRVPSVDQTAEKPFPPTEDSPPPVFRADIAHQVFNALLTNLGFSEVEARQLSDSIKTRLAPGSLAFSDISELRPMPGVGRERFLRLSPVLCALPEQNPQININTLGYEQLPLLQALFLNKASQNALQQLLASRPFNGWKNVSDPAFQQTLRSLHLPPLEGEKLLATRSHYFYVRLTTESDRSGYQLQSFLRYQRKKISVIERQLRYGREQ
ncbi:type II secretion system minor pseudopilin GspK [Serratia sp. 2723]|uniref:type II secretion system minor pseudopilin GspK n=1 Tax=unclassified Serratia (in: enterobacteria) TaxID=2647522 RepID=UPI003D204986